MNVCITEKGYLKPEQNYLLIVKIYGNICGLFARGSFWIRSLPKVSHLHELKQKILNTFKGEGKQKIRILSEVKRSYKQKKHHKKFNVKVDSRSLRAAGTRKKEQEEEGGRKKFGPR